MRQLFTLLLFSLVCTNCSTVKEEGEAPDLPKVASGSVERISDFESEFVIARNVDVWLPSSYTEDKEHAVIYMHDGQMLFDSTTTWNGQEWKVDEVLGQMLSDHQIQDVIVVGIWSTPFRHSEYFPQKPFENLPLSTQDSLLNFGSRGESEKLFQKEICSDNYLKFIVRELKPFIDKKYATRSGTAHTFIMGSSMGGLISIYALCEYPAVFSGAGCLSTHWVGTFDTINNPIPLKFVEYLDNRLPNPNNHKIYFDFGTQTLDALYEPYQKLVDSVMVKKGYDTTHWQTVKYEGKDHSERAWSERLHVPTKFLLAKDNG